MLGLLLTKLPMPGTKGCEPTAAVEEKMLCQGLPRLLWDCCGNAVCTALFDCNTSSRTQGSERVALLFHFTQ